MVDEEPISEKEFLELNKCIHVFDRMQSYTLCRLCGCGLCEECAISVGYEFSCTSCIDKWSEFAIMLQVENLVHSLPEGILQRSQFVRSILKVITESKKGWL